MAGGVRSDIPTNGTPMDITDFYGERHAQNNKWNLKVTLDNHTTKPFPLTTAQIKKCVIEEDLFNWCYKGELVYDNNSEVLERSKNKNAWFYRNDGRDELNIKIRLDSKRELPKEIWEIDLDFVVYETEDIPTTDNVAKAKKIYFWDKRYQYLHDRKIQWSTATAGDGTDRPKGYIPALASDEDRSMFTGDAIKALLKEAFAGPVEAGLLIEIDEENWDKGASKILYTSPANSNVIQDLNFLLSVHVSANNKNDACLLKLDRHSKKFQLIALSKFYEKAGSSPKEPGPLQIEHLFFEGSLQGQKNTTEPLRAPVSNSTPTTKDIKVGNWNTIKSYNFIDMAGIDSSNELVSNPVFWYDFKTGIFGADYSDNDIVKVKKHVAEEYVDKLLGEGTLITLNKSKTEQYSIDPQFTFSTASQSAGADGRSAYGKKKMLYASVVLNEGISYRVMGSTHRVAGTFVGIDRVEGGNNSKLDNKLCGQWFVKNVKHVWWQNFYMNDVIAMKIHSYEDQKINEKVS